MILELLRFSSGGESTLGALFEVHPDHRKFLCFTLEDEARTEKVWGETRIPRGTYQIKLRTEGGFHERYARDFKSAHKGMLWLQDVPNFKWVLIHIGNWDDDTAGCILVGDAADQNVTKDGMIRSSATAYKRVYAQISERLLEGEDVWITVVDYA